MGAETDWQRAAGELAEKVRPETRSKYFPGNPLRQAVIRRFLDRLAGELGAFEWESLLDLGCGEGFVDYFFRERFPGRSITGIEPDDEALAVAKKINPGVTYLHGDGRDLPFPDGCFDACVCIEVLEHLRDHERIIFEAARVSGGPCIFSVPAWPWYQLTNFMIGKNWKTLGEHPDHVVRFRGGEFRDRLSKHFGSASVRLVYPWLVGVCTKA